MIILTIEGLTKAFGVDEVLRGIDLTLQEGQKLGLVGVNGSGKTTLMRIIAGLDGFDGGTLRMRPDMSIGYHEQLGDITSERTVYEELESVFEPVFELERRLRAMEEDMAHLHSDEAAFRRLSNEYDRLTDRYERMGGYSYKSSIAGVLAGLSLPPELHGKRVSLLSGGERTRVKLARLLLTKPDLLLMDEPTNHLDLEAIGWLEDYLKSFRGSAIVISHDRYFLDAICDTTAEISGGVSTQYQGNYSRFLELRSEAYERRMKEYTLQQKEIERQKAIIARYRSYAQEWSIRKAKTREHVLEKMELVERPRGDEASIDFSFHPRRRSGNDVLIAEGLSKRYGDRQLFAGLDLHIRSGERVALIGPNGVGKTTLLRILMGDERADSGDFMFGANVDRGYYDQQQASLTEGKQVIDEVWDAFPRMSMTQVRSSLAAFLLCGDDVFRTVSTLSGGERGRVMFTKLMLHGDNFLILDEPTNHLDMDSREVLEAALVGFSGTLLFVSHDRFFINRIADRVVEMSPEGVREYLGNYDDYLSAKRRERQPEQEADTRTKTAALKEKRREKESAEKRRELRQRAEAAEREIPRCEQAIEELERRMSDPATYRDAELAKSLAADYAREKARLDALYEDWERLLQEQE